MSWHPVSSRECSKSKMFNNLVSCSLARCGLVSVDPLAERSPESDRLLRSGGCPMGHSFFLSKLCSLLAIKRRILISSPQRLHIATNRCRVVCRGHLRRILSPYTQLENPQEPSDLIFHVKAPVHALQVAMDISRNLIIGYFGRFKAICGRLYVYI